MDSGKRTIELEAESNRLKEGEEPQKQLNEEIPNQKHDKFGNVSEVSYGLIVKVRTMEDEYMKMRDELIESRKRRWSEEVNKAEEKCRRLEAEKRNLEMDLEMSARSGDEAVEKLKAAEDEIEALKSLLECKITEFGREKMKIKEELQDWVLQMEEAVIKKFTEAKRAKGNGDLPSSDKKKRLEEDEQHMKAQEFLQRIRVSEKEKGEVEAEACKLKREISLEKEKDLYNMTAMEAKDKKIVELRRRIEALEKENRAIEANHANREKREIDRKSKELMDAKPGKRTVKEEGEKEILELVHKIGIFEKEKRDLQEEIRQKDEVIQVLGQENDCLENKIEKLNMLINKRAVKLEEAAESPQQMHLVNTMAGSSVL